MTPELLALAARVDCEAQGCTCAVEIEVETVAPGLYRAHAQHDDNCWLLRRLRASQS